MSQSGEVPSPGRGGQGSVDVTVLGLVGGAPAQGWGGDTARRFILGCGRVPSFS